MAQPPPAPETEPVVRRVLLDYWEDVIEDQDQTRRVVGRKRMRCTVEATVDMATILASMGRRAACSKGGKCVDGHVTVRRVGKPQELYREEKKLP